MIGGEMFYTYDGMNIVCKDIEACFYRVGILLRHFETDRNLNRDGRGWRLNRDNSNWRTGC